jgi:small conductance mechanosensitive channel
VVEGRIISLMTIRPGRGSFDERKNRAQTLVGAFRYAATVAVVVGGILTILQEIGVSVAPLLGGAAVVGLAVAFGTQNLIRDYFTGFLILMENQYGINDVIRIGGTSGTVERITLRTTVLRDLEGVVHFIPNGEIKQVSNLTHGWSRAVFEIGVAYKEDVDQVMKVLIEIGEHLREDETFANKIIDQPTMLGVDSFGDSAVVIKFFMKTRPLQQWEVKREMLRRIKMRFDELGIEIPFPHRTVFHRSEDGSSTLDGRELAGLRSARDD